MNHASLPYIGITGFRTREQVEQVFRMFNHFEPEEAGRSLHVGVMTSHETLNNLPSRYERVYPRWETFSSIFCFDDGVYNCLHYVDTENRPDIVTNLAKAIMYGGVGIHAVQLDMTWPEPEHIMEAVHRSRKNIEVILQVGQRAFDEIDNDPVALVDKLEPYEHVVNRVLLDRSAGQGLEMDPSFLLPFAREITKNFPGISLDVAGGLGPKTVHLVKPLLDEFPGTSFNALGQLHTDGDIFAGPLCLGASKRYLTESFQLIKQARN